MIHPDFASDAIDSGPFPLTLGGHGKKAGGSPTHKETSKESQERERKDRAKKEDELLDEALEESFPASDPPAPAQPSGRGPAGDPATKP